MMVAPYLQWLVELQLCIECSTADALTIAKETT